MVEAANRGLEADPNQGFLLVIAATTLAQSGSSGAGPSRADLARAQEVATQLLDKLSNEPEAIRMGGLDDEQWAAQKQLWEGLGHMSLGQVALHEGSTDPPVTAKIEKAIGEFKTAGPLLQADPTSYAGNQFLLGFAYAKLADYDSARAVLNEVVASENPYTAAARDLLGKLPARRR
jgi:tetratricopeptide (TPR) repeat protein